MLIFEDKLFVFILKDPGVPNSCPFKEEVLREVEAGRKRKQEMKEKRRDEIKQRREEAKAKALEEKRTKVCKCTTVAFLGSSLFYATSSRSYPRECRSLIFELRIRFVFL